MSYVASVLQPGERIIRDGRLHWIVYWHAILFLVLAVLCAMWASSTGMGIVMMFCTIAFGVLAVAGFGVAWFKRWTTEIAITFKQPCHAFHSEPGLRSVPTMLGNAQPDRTASYALAPLRSSSGSDS